MSRILVALKQKLRCGIPIIPKRDRSIENDNIQSNSVVIDVSDDDNTLQDKKQLCSTRIRNLHRGRSAPAMPKISQVKKSLERPKLDSITSMTIQAFSYLIIYLVMGAIFYCLRKDQFSGLKTNTAVDALYFSIVTMFTIGYGDIVPMSVSTKLFTCFFALLGFIFIKNLLCGMVAYVLNKQERFLLSAVEGTPHDITDVKKDRNCTGIMFGVALGVVILCIGIGTIAAHILEKLKWVDAFYLSVMSVTTVGYGDRAFNTVKGRMFACVWLLVSTLAVARAVLYFAQCKAKIDERKHSIAKRVLQRAMTAEDLMAADMDHNGLVTKSEYVLYKLKEMKKVQDIDIAQITEQFDRLDSENCGKITLKSLFSGL